MARRFDWSDLEVLLHIADAGSISGAAKTLKMSQPAVSTRLRKLEDDLKCQLLVRHAQGVAMTEIGQLVLEQVRGIERLTGAVDRLARARDSSDEGRVRLSAPDGMSAFWLAPRLADFVRMHPRIELSIDAGLWPQDPVREELDIALQYEQSKIGDFISYAIASVPYAFFASERYIALYGKPETLADIAAHRTIHHSAQKQQKDTWDPGLLGVQASANLETNCSATVVMGVFAGVGIGLMPTAVASFLPGLVMLGEKPIAQPNLYISYHSDIAKIARVRRVIDWLKQVYDPEENPWYRSDFVHPREFTRYGAALLFEAPREKLASA